jgi:hypothetical protein
MQRFFEQLQAFESIDVREIINIESFEILFFNV